MRPAPNVFTRFRTSRLRDEERAKTNPFLQAALEEEKHEGHRIATIARTIALGIIGLLLPYLNPTPGVLFYEVLLLAFIAIGWLQFRVARVGQSRIELNLILADLILLTLIAIVPNPFLSEEIPAAFTYRFGNFIYFFVLLAIATLAYSWRTVWAMGAWVTILWLGGLAGVVFFGHEMPALRDATQLAFADFPFFLQDMDPNNAQIPLRVQEVVVFAIVAAILALKGWRSNQLLMRQADLAEQRANLSRYFAPTMVDVLASSAHDVGAVRSQNVAVLFVDIVGFTKIAEQHPPEKVMQMLRRYHAVIENAIFENGGTLDKYLGDGVMATFGTPQTSADDALNAISSARQLIDDMKILNTEFARNGDPQLPVSVGLHFGTVILGDVGPARRLEFAVLGDTVNVASRLEAATRSLKCSIVCSDDLVQQINGTQTAKQLLDGFEPKSALTVRGRSAPIDVWTFGGTAQP